MPWKCVGFVLEIYNVCTQVRMLISIALGRLGVRTVQYRVNRTTKKLLLPQPLAQSKSKKIKRHKPKIRTWMRTVQAVWATGPDTPRGNRSRSVTVFSTFPYGFI